MTTATVKTKLTHKVGPFPVYVWAGLALAAWFLIFHGPFGRAAKAAGGTQLPYTPAAGSGAQQPASGQGNAVDNTNADLMAALQGNTSAGDALLAALQYDGGGGTTIVSGGGSGATDTTQTTAPTIDSSTNNAPVVTQAAAYDPAQAASAAALGVSAQPNMTLDQLNAQLAEQGRAPLSYPDTIQPAPAPTMIGGPSQVAPPVPFGTIPFGTFTQPTQVTQPTPTIVQPAPVDAGNVLTPRPTPGHAIAV